MNALHRKIEAMLLMIAALILAGIQLTGCATPEHTVEKLETQNIDVKGRTVDGGRIAVTEDGQAVVQVEKSAEDELRVQDLANTYFQDQLHDAMYHLKVCREAAADPRNGGSGEVAPLPAVDHLEPLKEVQEKLGVTEDGGLKLVSREFLDSRIKSLRQYERSLKTMIETVKPYREECERKLAYKGVKP